MANLPLLHYVLEPLKGLVSEAIIVVGYRGDMIKDRLGNSYNGLNIRYIEQKVQSGTADALAAAREYMTEKTLVINGDDIYSKEDLSILLRQECALLCTEVDDPSRFGVVNVKDGLVESIEEKPRNPKSNTANLGAYVLPHDARDYIMKVKRSIRGEYEIVDVINALARKYGIVAVRASHEFISVGYSWDLLDVNSHALSLISESRIDGEIESGATIKGSVIIGKGTIVRSGAYIEGPVVIGENCTIGPNCYIRQGVSIGNGCKIGNAVEIKNSILLDDVRAGHLTYLGDSIVGEGSNLGAGTISANLRHDGGNVVTRLRDKTIDTRRRKIGVIIGDHVHTAIHTSFYPARKMWPHTSTYPGEVLARDRME